MKWTWTIFIILLQFPSGFAQTSNTNLLDENILRESIHRILIYNFKPRKTATTIRIAESIFVHPISNHAFRVVIRQEWLPRIRHLTFQTIHDREIQYNESVFVFESFAQNKDTWSISVGWRGECEGNGKVWKLGVRKGKVNLWPSKDLGWGAVYCDTGPGFHPQFKEYL